ncbi:flocculation protein, putative [Candida dubliniensis CD36]|uniref:Flocculation protein, putative n=1 Tax=Candida dubliniensis (strain CD36 / ATCC MYA-646 / CBS 7987 / NCPF 3949 / NRRL Y-17841) TaxID=573826 RepID=B9WCC9_CANDC|nr:flocculation protein, putative [Candida dubliniensis CD36]CAX44051.1 flocculation protein, putative [Candida dubliniensis CD36]
MKVSTIFAAASALFAATTTMAQDVACLINNQQVAVVDLDTGVCPFTIPDSLAAFFTFVSLEEYNVQFYYTIVNNVRYNTDIRNAGKVINVPARSLYGVGAVPYFQVHLEKQLSANSTTAIRRRLMGETPIVKRDEIDDFIASIENTEGTAIPGGDTTLQVVDYVPGSSSSSGSGSGSGSSTDSGSGSGTGSESATIRSTTVVSSSSCESSGAHTDGAGSTVTEDNTVVVTITSCHNDACHATTVPATVSTGVTTIHGTETVYTTYCPLSSYESVESTKVITITSCSENKCHPATVEAIPSTVTTVTQGVVTEYITYCPVSSVETATPTKVITVVACNENKCHETTAIATPTEVSTEVEGTSTNYITYKPTGSGPTQGETFATNAITSEGTVYVPKTTAVTTHGSTFETVAYITVSKATPAKGGNQPGGSQATATPVPGAPGAPGAQAGSGNKATVEAQATQGAFTPENAGGANGEQVAVSAKTTISQTTVAKASGSGKAAISTFEAAAASAGASILALALIPLAYFI